MDDLSLADCRKVSVMILVNEQEDESDNNQVCLFPNTTTTTQTQAFLCELIVVNPTALESSFQPMLPWIQQN